MSSPTKNPKQPTKCAFFDVAQLALSQKVGASSKKNIQASPPSFFKLPFPWADFAARTLGFVHFSNKESPTM